MSATSTVLTNFSLDAALQSIQAAFSSIKTLISVISYIIGVTFVVRGVMMYRAFANQTFGSAQRGELMAPMISLLVGAILLYFPSTLNTSLNTIFGNSNISDVTQMIGYSSTSSTEKWQTISAIIVNYMELLGMVAFVRGWVLLAKMGHSGSQPGSVGKGLIHIIGGILLMNIVQTVNILACTFGYVGGGC